MLMTLALILTQFLQSLFFQDVDANELGPVELERYRKLFEYFGTFTRAFLSFFELTLANWPPVTRLLSEELSEWFTMLCLAHKLTIGFAVVGVINGVILQETFKAAANDDVIMVRQKRRAEKILYKKMQSLMAALDHSDDGQLDYNEFMNIANHPEVKLWLASLDIDTDDVHMLFKLLDENEDGVITAKELTSRVPRLRGTARAIDVMALRRTVEKTLMKSVGMKRGASTDSRFMD